MEYINNFPESSDKKHKKAIVFVHGLNGSRSTWIGEDRRFINTIKKDTTIVNEFGIYIYEYHTKIFEFACIKRMLSIIPLAKKKWDSNVGVRRIAMTLRSHIQSQLDGYDAIVLVGHSMGGLVCKRVLVEMSKEELAKVKLFLSLSVPHNGSLLGSLGSTLFGKNKQLVDLEAFSDFTADLTNRYSNLKNKPKAIYQAGNQDEVVPESSAIPAGVVGSNRIDTSDNHFSVVVDADKADHIPYKRLLKELNDIIKLNKQLSLSSSANAPVNFNIPEGWTFQEVARSLARTAQCTIEFNGFTEQELSINMSAGEIQQRNTFSALNSLIYVSNDAIPMYTVDIIDTHFIIEKN